MNSFHENPSTGTASKETGPGAETQANLDPRALLVCCGSSIAPRLAEIRRLGEPTLFVTVWQCPECKRVAY